MKRLIIRIMLFIFVLALLVTPLGAQELDKNAIVTAILLQSLQTWHYSPQEIDNRLSQRIFKLYLQALDPNKQFLLKSDVEQLKDFQYQLDSQLQNGARDFYDISWLILRQRITETSLLVQKILKEPFDFSANETLKTDPKKRDFPDGLQELQEYWRLNLKYRTLLTYLEIMNPPTEQAVSKEKSESSPIDPLQPFQPEIERQAREKVARNLKRSFDRLLRESEEKRFGEYLNAIACSFDPHSEYFLPEQRDEFDSSITGVMEGIGATLREDGDYTRVVEIIPGSAAWRQKALQADDIILKVAQGQAEPVDIATMPINEVVKLIRGKKGSEVRLTVKKPDGQIVVIPIIRDVVVMEDAYAKSAVIVNEQAAKKYGYINLPSFYQDFKTNSHSSADDIRAELQKLKTEGVSGIILDLRNNGGGSLDDAVRMAGLFIREGPIVQVKDHRGQKEILSDPDPGVVYNGPLVVMVNSLSASASEILAAALQDYGRAVIVGGPRTFSKGTVQTVLDLDQLLPKSYASIKPAGSLKLTIAKFYRINGGSTQGKGVTADIALPDLYGYLKTGEQNLDYHLPWDTTSAAAYKSWNNGRLDIARLRRLSQRRVQASKSFQLISSNIDQIRRKQEEARQTLKFTGFMEEQKLLRTESEQLKNLPVEQPSYMKIISPQAKPGDEDPQSVKTMDWLKQINKDAYINEAWHILGDM
jgi:carboxyl-terminal processing protease